MNHYAADAAAVDYYAVGPVFETPTKEGRPATGWDLIANFTGAMAAGLVLARSRARAA